MPAKSKVISDTDVQNFEEILQVAELCKANHTEIARLTDELEGGKATLVDSCRTIFFKDLGAVPEGDSFVLEDEVTPDVFGNHEFHTDKGQVTVNFSVKKKTFQKVGGRPAPEVLKETFEDQYEKLFKEVPMKSVSASEEELRKYCLEHPTMFGFSIKPDTPKEKLADIYKLFPDVFDVYVSDIDAFEKEHENKVDTSTGVVTETSFLEKVGKLPENLRKKDTVKKFLVGLLGMNLTTKVLCGNTSKKGS